MAELRSALRTSWRAMAGLKSGPTYALLKPLVASRDRQRHREARALAARPRHVDPAVVRVDDLPHDRQPESRPLRLRREERVEHAILQLVRNPGAVVGNLDDQHRHARETVAALRVLLFDGARPRRNPDAPLAVHGLERVDHQVREHRTELVLVALDSRQVLRHRELHLEVTAARLAL